MRVHRAKRWWSLPIGASDTAAGAPITSASANSTAGGEGNVIQDGDINHNAGVGGKHGMFALEDRDIFNILVIPPRDFDNDVAPGTWAAAADYCMQRRAFLIIDSPAFDNLVPPATPANNAVAFTALTASLAPGSLQARYASYFFPRFIAVNSLNGKRQQFAASGASHSTSKKASSEERSGSCSSPTTSHSGQRSA